MNHYKLQPSFVEKANSIFKWLCFTYVTYFFVNITSFYNSFFNIALLIFSAGMVLSDIKKAFEKFHDWDGFMPVMVILHIIGLVGAITYCVYYNQYIKSDPKILNVWYVFGLASSIIYMVYAFIAGLVVTL